MALEAPLDVAARVAAAVAHDFNNHIAAIALQAELALASEPADEKLRRRLEGILGSCEHARRLTGDLLAFGGRRALRPTTLELGEAVRRAAPAGARVELAGAPLLVDVDAGVFDEAVAELAAAAEDGRPSLSVTADGEDAVLRVGLGAVAADDVGRRRFFEPLASEELTLGLARVYGFVRQSGGTVEVEQDGDGAVVVLRLPRAPA